MTQLVKHHIVFCERETYGLLYTISSPCNVLQSLIDGGVKIRFPASRTHPGGDMIHIDRLAVELESGSDLSLFHGTLTKLACLSGRHDAHSLLFLLLGSTWGSYANSILTGSKEFLQTGEGKRSCLPVHYL